MRIIFVGMHNKPGVMPLCTSTKSGKLIKRIYDKLPKGIEVLRTNLYNIDYYPANSEKLGLILDWYDRIEPNCIDIIVLLGAEVHKNFKYFSFIQTINLGHPSGVWSNEAKSIYVLRAIEKIKTKINKQ